jgi:hypothetical protein
VKLTNWNGGSRRRNRETQKTGRFWTRLAISRWEIV